MERFTRKSQTTKQKNGRGSKNVKTTLSIGYKNHWLVTKDRTTIMSQIKDLTFTIPKHIYQKELFKLDRKIVIIVKHNSRVLPFNLETSKIQTGSPMLLNYIETSPI